MTTTERTQLESLPAEVRVWDFSLSRSASLSAGRGKFRWRLPDGEGEWLCDELAGRLDILEAKGETGNLIVRCQIILVDSPTGVTAYCYPDGEDDLDAEGYRPDPSKPAHESHWRLCYFRQDEKWRLRDERSGNLWFVDGYRGRINANWLDQGTHIFHDGVVEVDTDNIAHFKV